MVSANLTNVAVCTNECALVKNLLRSVVGQSDNVDDSRNNYCIVRSNNSVTLLELTCQEWQRVLLKLEVLTVITHVVTMSLSVPSARIPPPVWIVIIGNPVDRIRLCPLPEHSKHSLVVNSEWNLEDTTCVVSLCELSLLWSSLDSTVVATSIVSSVVLPEAEGPALEISCCRVDVIFQNTTVAQLNKLCCCRSSIVSQRDVFTMV